MAFVFAAMIEFTFVNYSTRRKPRVKIKNRAQEMSLSEQVHKLVSNYSQQVCLKFQCNNTIAY